MYLSWGAVKKMEVKNHGIALQKIKFFFHTSPTLIKYYSLEKMTNGRSQEIEAQARKGPFTDFKKAFPFTFFLNYFTFYHQNVNNIAMSKPSLSVWMYAKFSVLAIVFTTDVVIT